MKIAPFYWSTIRVKHPSNWWNQEDVCSTLALPWRISVYTEAGSTASDLSLVLFAALEVAARGKVRWQNEEKLRQDWRDEAR